MRARVARKLENDAAAGRGLIHLRTAGDKVNPRALRAMLKQIIANNRAAGWRKLKGS